MPALRERVRLAGSAHSRVPLPHVPPAAPPKHVLCPAPTRSGLKVSPSRSCRSLARPGCSSVLFPSVGGRPAPTHVWPFRVPPRAGLCLLGGRGPAHREPD